MSPSNESATIMSVGDAITAEQIAERDAVASEKIGGYAAMLGDDALMLAQRLSAWVTRAPEIEEDIALTNIALDVLGHARFFYTYAGTAWGKTEDDLAYFRDEEAFRSARLVERPNGDFAHTIARQLLVSAYFYELYARLSDSADPTLAAIADKSLKEVAYHLDHAAQWTLRLAGGTEESARRMRRGLDSMWPYLDELFVDVPEVLVAEEDTPGVAVMPSELREPVMARIGAFYGKSSVTVGS